MPDFAFEPHCVPAPCGGSASGAFVLFLFYNDAFAGKVRQCLPNTAAPPTS
jgi:hypothetical protein